MYLRVTLRHNRDGSSVTYYALAAAVLILSRPQVW
jgi:hypothetical protein